MSTTYWSAVCISSWHLRLRTQPCFCAHIGPLVIVCGSYEQRLALVLLDQQERCRERRFTRRTSEMAQRRYRRSE